MDGRYNCKKIYQRNKERNLIRTEKKRDTQRQVEKNSIKDAKHNKRYKEISWRKS